MSRGKFLPPAGTAERSASELFRLLSPAWILMVSFMLLSERFPRANEDFEDLDKGYKSWEKWCEL